MNPALQGILYNQMMQPQSPIDMQKQQLGFNPQEQRNAEGLAIQQFFANMGASRNPDQLGRINESFNPAVKAYMSEQQRVQDLNSALMEQQQKQADREEDRAYRRESLASRNKEGNYLLHEMQNQKLREDGKIPENAITAKGLPANERLHYTKERTAKVKRGLPAGNVIKITNELDRIIDKYPDLSTDMINALVTSKKGSPGFIDIAKLKLADNAAGKERRAAIEIFNKLSNDLVVQSIGGVSGRVASDMYKELLSATKPQLGLTREAIKYVNQHIREEQMPWYEEAKANQKAMSAPNGGYYLPDYVPELEAPQQAIPQAPIQQEDRIDYGDATQEEIAEAKRIVGMQ